MPKKKVIKKVPLKKVSWNQDIALKEISPKKNKDEDELKEDVKIK